MIAGPISDFKANVSAFMPYIVKETERAKFGGDSRIQADISHNLKGADRFRARGVQQEGLYRP